MMCMSNVFDIVILCNNIEAAVHPRATGRTYAVDDNLRS